MKDKEYITKPINWNKKEENSAHSFTGGMITDSNYPTLEGWEKHWEEDNKIYPQGINPHAYRLGFLKATKLQPSVTEGSQEELWNHVEQILRYREDEDHPINYFNIARKPKKV